MTGVTQAIADGIEPEELTVDVEAVVEAEGETVQDDTREKILFILGIYPYISRSMIQVALGPGLPPKLWDPVLAGMVDKKEVCHCWENVTAPNGRASTKGVYYLPSFPYPPTKLA